LPLTLINDSMLFDNLEFRKLKIVCFLTFVI